MTNHCVIPKWSTEAQRELINEHKAHTIKDVYDLFDYYDGNRLKALDKIKEKVQITYFPATLFEAKKFYHDYCLLIKQLPSSLIESWYEEMYIAIEDMKSILLLTKEAKRSNAVTHGLQHAHHMQAIHEWLETQSDH